MDKRYKVSFTLTAEPVSAVGGHRVIIRDSYGRQVYRVWGKNEETAHKEALDFLKKQFPEVTEIQNG